MVGNKKAIAKSIAFKLARFLIALWITVTLIFFLFRLMPGDPLTMYLESIGAGKMGGGFDPTVKMAVEYYKEAFGLDKDIFTQYALYLENLILRGDFGPSIMNFPESSKVALLRGLPWSIGLLGTASIIAWSIGLALGVLAGWFKDSIFSNIMAVLSLVLSQIPFYYLGIMMILLFGFTLHWFPTGYAYAPGVMPGFSLEFVSSVIYHAFLPACSLVAVVAAGRLLSSRALVVSILNEDYLHFAQAKGLKKGMVLYKYILRNALLPQVTALGMTLAFSINGSVLIETIFSYPGVGRLFMQAISFLDHNTISAFLFISAVVVFSTMLVMDLIYPFVDPRVRG